MPATAWQIAEWHRDTKVRGCFSSQWCPRVSSHLLPRTNWGESLPASCSMQWLLNLIRIQLNNYIKSNGTNCSECTTSCLSEGSWLNLCTWGDFHLWNHVRVRKYCKMGLYLIPSCTGSQCRLPWLQASSWNLLQGSIIHTLETNTCSKPGLTYYCSSCF